MARWYRAAEFKSLESATQAVVRLQGLFAGRRELITYRFAVAGPPDSQLLIAAALARDADDVGPHIDAQARSILLQKGELTPLPDILLDHLYADWASFPRYPLTLLGSLVFQSSLDEPVEDSVAVVSHAKCRDCGQIRHKIARLNLCQTCWERVKPTIRRQWREIKDRRRLRRAVDEHIEEQHRARAAQAELRQLQEQANRREERPVSVSLTPQEAAKQEIARLRAEGLVPKPNTPEFGPYMRLHQIAKGYNAPGGRTPPPLVLTDKDHLMRRMYLESDVPVGELQKALDYDPNRLFKFRHQQGFPIREDWQKTNPPTIHMADHEQLLVQDGKPYFKSRRTGDVRLAFDDAEPVLALAADRPLSEEEQHTVQEAFAQAMAEPVAEEPVAEEPVVFNSELTAKGTPRKRTYTERKPNKVLTEAEQLEVLRLYDDFSISTDEIVRAYGISNGQLHRVISRHKVPLRSTRPGYKPGFKPGRLELIDGKQTWVPNADAKQLHLGQAPGAEEMPAMPEPTVSEDRQNGAEAAPEAAQPTQLVVARQPVIDFAVRYSEPVWTVTYVSVATVHLNADSIDAAIQAARQTLGADINIVNVQRDGGALWKS